MTITTPFEVEFDTRSPDVNEAIILDLNSQDNHEVKVIYDELIKFGIPSEKTALVGIEDFNTRENRQTTELQERNVARDAVTTILEQFSVAKVEYRQQLDELHLKLQQLEISSMLKTVQYLNEVNAAIAVVNDLNQKAQTESDNTLNVLKLREQNYVSTLDALPAAEVPVKLNTLQVLMNRSKTLLSSLTKKE
jgi:hypothetical protein